MKIKYTNLKKYTLFSALIICFYASFVNASESVYLDVAPNLSKDKDALQRGAKLFVNYCLGCHSANAVRFNTLTKIGFSEQVIKENLLFVGGEITDLMKLPNKPSDAQKWFGIIPPDLSTAARVRSADWIYTFLRSYYVDDKAVSGFNNTVFHNTAMPNVFWQLQGNQKLVNGSLKLVKSGLRSNEEFNRDIAELTAFISWMSDPTKEERQKLGYFALAFMLLLTFLAYMLKKEYWKDIK